MSFVPGRGQYHFCMEEKNFPSTRSEFSGQTLLTRQANNRETNKILGLHEYVGGGQRNEQIAQRGL